MFIQSFEFENLIELQNQIMPAAGVDLPLVQLYGDINVPPADGFGSPYDMLFNAAQGTDLQAIYGELASLVEISDTTGYGDLISQEVFAFMAANYAEGIGPFKDSFLLRKALATPVDTNGDGAAEVITRLTGEVHPFLARALDAGLLVHPYTLRAEEPFLTLHPNGVPQNVVGEAVQLYGLGVQGFFIDQPNLGVRGRTLFLKINGKAARND